MSSKESLRRSKVIEYTFSMQGLYVGLMLFAVAGVGIALSQHTIAEASGKVPATESSDSAN